MPQTPNVADAVVRIFFDVTLQRFRVVEKRDANEWRELVTVVLSVDLRGVLTSFGSNQAIEAVVGEVTMRFDLSIAKENGLLSGVTDRNNVSYRVVSIVQILKVPIVAVTHTVQPRQQKSSWIIVIGSGDVGSISGCVRDPFPFSLCVVINIGDKERGLIRTP